MERNRKNVILACLVATNFASTSIVAGEIIVYDHVGGTTTLGIAPKSIISTGGGFIPNTIAPRSSISNNIVTVISTGSETVNNVIGGFSDDKNVEKNTVNILGNPKFRANIILYGGNKGSGTGDTFTGNTINIASKGLFVSNIANFEFINFYLPKNIAPNDTVFTLTNRPNFSVSKLGVALANDNTSLNVGDRINLVKSNAGVIAPNDLSNHINDPKNILKLSTTSTTFSNIYSFDILSDTTSIYTVVKNKENNPQQKSILEAGASMTGMLNIASDSIDSVLAKGYAGFSTYE
ncbi:putative high-molecular-weight surface-exposed protein [Campylobacter hyointestinalis]|uniref:hypothetical protein n=1 Tax=Campylobacter hyointestinalis TaxID=198 RepID=UPI0004DAFA15|nr:hypothetical protein [Campylobacter hyointestinalis]KEA44353.1 hypothetical protein CR67_05905 [Campylobacter hyointestinalis subsp. hyointestinalis]QKF55572.1 hypothetical protein CHHT_0718 [Campylobacter hyointestinalis subsp. hyointestinalis]TXK47360.1 hypothetical protein A0Z69_04960 [Campylobacter hyointestinalis]SFT57076.1 hypothetical protein SAMN05421691_1269 [Campylobacter hyointestinalis]SUW90309.1 putative high-molecular-weight surface-exposed protein [Campylobacter hyointestinal